MYVYIDILDEAITEVLNKTYVNKTWDKYQQATQKNMQTILFNNVLKRKKNWSELLQTFTKKPRTEKHNNATVQFTTV